MYIDSDIDTPEKKKNEICFHCVICQEGGKKEDKFDISHSLYI